MKMDTSVVTATLPLSRFAESVCVVIVTYRPDNGLFDRVQRVAAQVAQTVIVDNGSPPPCVQSIRELAHTIPVHLILNKVNEGIACALNAGTRWAASRGFRWVLTLDQDTIVLPDMVDAFAEVVHSYPAPERLAVIGSNYRDMGSGRLFYRGMIETNGFPGIKTASVLTSGSLISVAAFQTIGGFREDFFIDCVDHDYCLHARARGFHVVLTNKPLMEHGIGHLTEHRLLWRKVYTSNHSPVREYFRTRNSVFLVREYIRLEPRWMMRYLWAWLKSLVLMFLFEKQRFLKMKNLIRGCFDGALGRSGSTGSLNAGL
jgi:rhamnosyltransferase